MEANIRIATMEDIEILVELGLAMHTESPRYQDIPWSDAKIRHLGVYVLDPNHREKSIVFIAEKDGKAIGLTVGMAVEHWFSEQQYVTELAVYVLPDYRRRTTAGIRLVRALEAWAETIGVNEVRLGVSAGISVDSTVAFYERLGYTKDSTSLSKKLSDV